MGTEKQGVSRRDLFKLGGIAMAGAVGASALAGCAPQGSDSASAQSGEQAEGIGFAAGHERQGLPGFLQKPTAITDIAEVKEYDVVVVGAGASGTPAAFSAFEAGATVALLQKESTAIAQGNTGSGIDLASSDKGGAEALVQALVRDSQYRPRTDLLRVWTDNGGEAVQWVMDKVEAGGGSVQNLGNNQQSAAATTLNGYTLNYITAYMGPKPLNAGDGMRVLAEEAEKAGVEVFYSTPAVQLVQNDKGEVTGVIAESSEGYVQFNAKKGVIVATGDYQNDEEITNYYVPDLKNFERKQFNKTGDGHKMVIWAGGKMEDIGHTKMLHDFDAGPMWNMPFMAVKLTTGKRFTNEKIDMAYLNNFLTSAEDKGRYCQIFDGKYPEIAQEWKGVGKYVDPEGMKTYMPEEDVERKGVLEGLIATYQADTLEELAEKLGIEDVDAFIQETEHYNELCAQAEDADFGKESQYMITVDTPPYYGIKRQVRVSAICSGVEVTGDHQCLSPEGEPIKGLYAIGNCSGGFYGGVDYPLTVGGLSLGRCYTEGYVIGRLVANL